jgi:hypothetical protein
VCDHDTPTDVTFIGFYPLRKLEWVEPTHPHYPQEGEGPASSESQSSIPRLEAPSGHEQACLSRVPAAAAATALGKRWGRPKGGGLATPTRGPLGTARCGHASTRPPMPTLLPGPGAGTVSLGTCHRCILLGRQPRSPTAITITSLALLLFTRRLGQRARVRLAALRRRRPRRLEPWRSGGSGARGSTTAPRS